MPNSNNHQLRTSAYAALISGIILPVLEMIRRWRQLGDIQYLVNWIDDYLIGAILIVAAVKAIRLHQNGRAWLAAAWGFAAGMALSSLVSQLQHLDAVDPSSVSSPVVAAIKAVMLLICLVFLLITVRRSSNSKSPAHQ